jgi:hypothetical protein
VGPELSGDLLHPPEELRATVEDENLRVAHVRAPG